MKKIKGCSATFIIYWIPDFNSLREPGIFLPNAVSRLQFPMQKLYTPCPQKSKPKSFLL